MARPETLAVLAGVAAVLGLLGPYDTDQVLRFVPRLIYWIVIVAVTYSAGHIASGLLHQSAARHWGRVPLVLATALVIGIAVSFIVITINLAAFGILPDAASLPPFLLSTFAISLVISIVFDVVDRARRTAALPDTAVPLLDRLPFDKRGPLVALSVQDHYVDVRTTKGSDMLLMRLSDAIREVGPTPGLQIHRSHWAATDAITSVTRQGDKATLTMSHGPALPVSRANIPKLREAGLLPR